MPAARLFPWIVPPVWAVVLLIPYGNSVSGWAVWLLILGSWLLFRLRFWPLWFLFFLPWHVGSLTYFLYSGMLPGSSDLFLFFTHPEDVAESLDVFLPHLHKSLLHSFLLFVPVLWFSRRFPQTAWKIRGKIIISAWFAAALWFAPPLSALKAFFQWGSIGKQGENQTRQRRIHGEIQAVLSERIVLIIGESMRYDRRLHPDVRPIYAGGTNTDVSIPLLLNGFREPGSWYPDWGENLFALAKSRQYYTAFISAQSEGNLRYIRPFLGEASLDELVTTERSELAPRYDRILLDRIEPILDKKRFFAVLQMVGSHSPYSFFPQDFNPLVDTVRYPTTVAQNYEKSFLFSKKILEAILEKIRRDAPDTWVVFTSDHGEMTGVYLGHNRFEEEVYRVPFFSVGLPADWGNDIESHDDIYRLLAGALGYPLPHKETLKIHGSMQNGEDGYLGRNPSGRLERRWY